VKLVDLVKYLVVELLGAVGVEELQCSQELVHLLGPEQGVYEVRHPEEER
jgi:hypothetical protein